jgi:hypothetical protein
LACLQKRLVAVYAMATRESLRLVIQAVLLPFAISTPTPLALQLRVVLVPQAKVGVMVLQWEIIQEEFLILVHAARVD